MSNLTGELVLRRIYDAVSGGIKTTPASTTVMEIEINAADGDNVLVKPDNNLTSTLNEELSAVGMKTACVYSNAGTTGVIALEVSPVDTGDVWMEVASVTGAATIASATASICARRVRIRAKSGTPTGHLVIQAV